MIFLKIFPEVFMILSLLSGFACVQETVPCNSLWGKVGDFSRCSHWRLNPQVSIPALQELTVCLNLKVKAELTSLLPTTVFMYRHPAAQYAELGLGVKGKLLVVWLFGEEWKTLPVNLYLSQWYSVCITWSQTNNLTLFVNGERINMTAVSYPRPSSFASPSSCKLSPNGSLSLGAGHYIDKGNIQVIPYSSFPGKISMFRMWGKERSKAEVTSLKCTEGDIVKWEEDHWDTLSCGSSKDLSLLCEWSFYEVRLLIEIIRYDQNNTELYRARDIAHRWLRVVLPKSIYLHRVSVFDIISSSSEERLGGATSAEDRLKEWAGPNINRFYCLVHATVSPPMDVAYVQNEIHNDLMEAYHDPSGVLQLRADIYTIRTTPVDSFSIATISPPPVETDPTLSTTTNYIAGISSSSPSPTTTPEVPYTSMTTSMTTTMTTTRTTPTRETSTTIFPTGLINVSDLYFEIKMNVSITGDYNPQEILPIWLNVSLPDDRMVVLDIQLITKAERQLSYLQSKNISSDAVSIRQASRERLIFQVQVLMLFADTQEIVKQIRDLLLIPYNNGSITIATEDIEISRILVYKCNMETQQTLKGQFTWPETSGGKTAALSCPKNPLHSATRHCKVCMLTHWLDSNLEDCDRMVETIPDLDDIEVTPENAMDVVETIEDLLRDSSTLLYEDMVTVLNKLKVILNVSVVTPNLGQAVINVISNILESDSNLTPFTNTILNITESVGDRIVGYEGSFTLVAPAMALSVVDVFPDQFDSLYFGVTCDLTGINPEICIDECPPNGTVAFISLPSILKDSFPEHDLNQNPMRVQFQFYGIPLLFQHNHKQHILNSFVVSASVTNISAPIRDLAEDVTVMLHHMKPNALHKDVQCVYWNFNKNNGHGGWDDEGCRKHNSSSDYTTCLCNHLTHFGVLLDVSRIQLDPANDQILTIITYVGCGLSSLFLGITVLTYTIFDKLRRDYPSQILINLSLALLGLNLVFLVNSWLSSWGVYGLCVAVASTLHYFLLASFSWMGLEAVNMYFALVKVFNVYVPSYILKFCALGWGIPLVVCVLVLIINKEAYGGHMTTHSALLTMNNTDNFCWIQDNITFYVSVVAYAALLFLFNIGVFVVVLIQIRRMRVNSPAGTPRGLLHDLKGVASLTLLLGLTWTVGFFTWGPARIFMLYLFSVLNTLQGLFIFIFHCLMKENVRKQFRIHLCFGRFRLDEYSEWSNSASVGVKAEPRENLPRAASQSFQSVKSSSTESTSASSDSSQRDSSCKRPHLGLFVNSLALPRVQRGPPDTKTLASYRGVN